MDTEINQNMLIGHIAGLTEYHKTQLPDMLKKIKMDKDVIIIDVDTITTKIIDDDNMVTLFTKYEYHFERSKDRSISQNENRISLEKAKNIEKKMFQYWKVKMEFYINKIIKSSSKKILLVGYLSFFKNHRIYLNLNILTKFFLKVDFVENAKNIIRHNLEYSKEDIINGTFDLNYLDINFLVKKRINLQSIYTKINYITMNLNMILNTINLNDQISIPNKLYYASFIKYEKKIPIISDHIIVYSQEWLALTGILNTSDKINNNDNSDNNIEKGILKGVPFVKVSNAQEKKMKQKGYIYEIIDTENFLSFPTKNDIYKYFTTKPIKINRSLILNNILSELKKLNVNINLI